MFELSKDEYFVLEDTYININAAVNLLEAWAEQVHLLEVTMILEKIKPGLKNCRKIFKKH